MSPPATEPAPSPSSAPLDFADPEDAFSTLPFEPQQTSLTLPMPSSPHSLSPSYFVDDEADPATREFLDMLGESDLAGKQLSPSARDNLLSCQNSDRQTDDPLADLPALLLLSAPSSPLSLSSFGHDAAPAAFDLRDNRGLESDPTVLCDAAGVSANPCFGDAPSCIEDFQNVSHGNGLNHVHMDPVSDASTASSSSDRMSSSSSTARCTCGARELKARLEASTQENSNLRKRVAVLAKENREIRSALALTQTQLQAQMQSQAQAHYAHMHAITQIPQAFAQQVAAACSVGCATGPTQTLSLGNTNVDVVAKGRSAKRKRSTVTSMACLLLMFGAFFAAPEVRKSENASGPASSLPARVWVPSDVPLQRHLHGALTVYPAAVRQVSHSSHAYGQRTNVPRLPALGSGSNTPLVSANHGSIAKHEQGASSDMTTAIVHATDSVAARTSRPRDNPDYQYVLCKNSETASQSVRDCVRLMRGGKQCGSPHLISLILPASAAGLDDSNNDTKYDPSLEMDEDDDSFAEVHCQVVSVARIPKAHAAAAGYRRVVYPQKQDTPYYGRIISAVTEVSRP